jgi:hypothetical protein
MRRYFVMTEDGVGTNSLADTLKTEKTSLINQYDVTLQMHFPRGRTFDTKADEIKWFKDKKATETDHRNEVQLGLRRFVFKRAEADFYKFKGQVVNGKKWMNPWDPVLRDTMFWM